MNAYAHVRVCVIKLSWVSYFQVVPSENHKKVTILDVETLTMVELTQINRTQTTQCHLLQVKMDVT